MAEIRHRRSRSTVTRNDLRWARRHPLRWLAHWWPVLTLSAALTFIAATWADPTFSIVRLDLLWPVALAACAAVVLAAAVAPFHRRLRNLAGAGLVTVGVFRVVFYIDAIVLLDPTAAQAAQLAVQAAHWLIIALVGLALPSFVAETALRATVEAGRDDRGRDDRGGDSAR